MNNPLEEKIYSLVPELKELTFWCEVVIPLYWKCVFIFELNWANYFISEWTNITAQPKNNKTEIIGHPIHLEHIMLALSLSLQQWDTLNWHINSYKEFSFRTMQDTFLKDYKLDKPLSEQSDAVLKFLSENIK